MEEQHLDIMDKEGAKGAIEALLFIYGEPLTFKRLEKILSIDRSDIEDALRELQASLRDQKRGLRVVIDGRSAQLVTAPEYSDVLQAVVKEEFSQSLTPAALETLSIIAYRGPIGRSDIDYIRGVNSTFMLRNLLMRGLIERYENPARPKAYLYKASFDLLRMLGLEKIEDLPEYEKYSELSLASDDSPEDEGDDGDVMEMHVRNEDAEESEDKHSGEGSEVRDGDADDAEEGEEIEEAEDEPGATHDDANDGAEEEGAEETGEEDEERLY